jgi:hypothetical protein
MGCNEATPCARLPKYNLIEHVVGSALSSSPPSGIVPLARLYFDIALWRRGPQDVPGSPAVLPATVLVYIVITLLSILAANAALPVPAGAARQPGAALILADVALIGLWYRLLLVWSGRRERWAQTLAAIFGCSAWLAAPSVLTSQLVLVMPSGGWLSMLALILTLTLLVWGMLINAHILRHTLERSLNACIALVILQQVVEQLLAYVMNGIGQTG